MPEVELRGGEVDGLSLHYVVEGRGPAVVLVHGLGSFAESWRYTLPALTARATVYAIDLPGFGRSAKPPARYSLRFLARALHAFLDALGIGQVSLVGHSLGGAVCVTYALTHPARVERLALVGALVPGAHYRLAWPARLVAIPGVGELLALGGCAPLYRASIARCFYTRVQSEVDFLVESFYGARTCAEARAAFLAAVRGIREAFGAHAGDYRRALSTLDLPILLIHGRQDPVIPANHCMEAASGLPRASVRWVDRCGHFPHIEHVRVVNGWLAEFLAGRPAPR